MIKAVSALLVGASLFASGPAAAADFIRYSVAALGTYSAAVTTIENGQPTTRFSTVIRPANYEFLVPTSALLAVSYNSNPPNPDFPNPDQQTNKVTVTPTSLILSTERARSDIKFLGLEANVTLCGSFTNIGGFFTLDPSCSSASSTYLSGNPGGANTVTRFSGSVFSVVTSRFSSDTAQPGFESVPAIPEPATWAMMLVGFGMVGAVARRQRRVPVAA